MQKQRKKRDGLPPVKFPPMSVVCLKGKKEIGDFIKEDPNKIPELVKNEGLPAWKRDGLGPWRALNVDLFNWMLRQRNKYLVNAIRDAEFEHPDT